MIYHLGLLLAVLSLQCSWPAASILGQVTYLRFMACTILGFDHGAYHSARGALGLEMSASQVPMLRKCQVGMHVSWVAVRR